MLESRRLSLCLAQISCSLTNLRAEHSNRGERGQVPSQSKSRVPTGNQEGGTRSRATTTATSFLVSFRYSRCFRLSLSLSPLSCPLIAGMTKTKRECPLCCLLFSSLFFLFIGEHGFLRSHWTRCYRTSRRTKQTQKPSPWRIRRCNALRASLNHHQWKW